MRRATASGLIGLAILLCTPRPASAQWSLIKWLEGLSGPGHFWLSSYEVHIGCLPKTPSLSTEQASNQAAADIKAALNKGPEPLRALFCDQNPTMVGTTDRAVWKDVKFYFTAAFAHSLKGDDPLDYALEKDEPSLKTFTFGAAYRFNEWVDAGMAAGSATFRGSTSSTNFNKVLLDPYLLIRPFAGVKKERLQRLVSVKLDFVIFPEGFTDAEFGATSTKLDGGAELVTALSISVDVARLFWKN